MLEIRKKGEGLFRRKNGNHFYYFGETKGYKGVGFIVNETEWDKISEIKGINEQIWVLKTGLRQTINLALVQVYAPTSEANNGEIEDFYINFTIQFRKRANTLQ